MRSVDRARKRGDALRALVGLPADGLLARLIQFLKGRKVDVLAVDARTIGGSKAEFDADAKVIAYDRTLKGSDLVSRLAHELGHLELHGRLAETGVAVDPILASVYGDTGPAAIARYSPRVFEEAEAEAFALEFQCPSVALLAAWQADTNCTITSLSAAHRVDEQVIRVQLSSALHDLALNRGSEQIKTSHIIQFTDAQLAAARHVGSPALVDAGPGTGKTATLIRRLKFLLEERKAEPRQILVLTFSNEAAEELRTRAMRDLGDRAAGMTMSTFHGFGMEAIHYHGQHLGFDADPSLLDEDAQVELVYNLLGQVPCDSIFNVSQPWESAKILVDHINHCKHRLVSPEDLSGALEELPSANRSAASELIALYREYEREKQAARRIDFADLILLPLKLLSARPELAHAYHDKFPWVLVDEFQDVSRATSQLLSTLSGATNPPWVVGDARQAIYRFLGASPENVTEFKRDFPSAAFFHLESSYRSAPPIVAAANQLAALLTDPEANAAEELWHAGTEIAPICEPAVLIAEATSDHAEYEGIVAQIGSWMAVNHVPAGDIAVLARRNLDVRRIVLRLTDAGITAQCSGMLTADGAAGDLAAALTVADAPLASIPRLVRALRGAEDATSSLNTTIARLLMDERASTMGVLEGHAVAVSGIVSQVDSVRVHAQQERESGDAFVALTTFLFTSSQYLRNILVAGGSAARSMALVEVVSTLSLAAAYRATHPDSSPAKARVGFADRLRLHLTEVTPIPLVPAPRTDAVRVMTCHASKGLEFPCVIVAGQTLPAIKNRYRWLPASVRGGDEEDLAQACALLFVGVTRARQNVVVSYPKKATDKLRSKAKTIVPLISAWRDRFGVVRGDWTTPSPADETVVTGPIWGASLPKALRPTSVDQRSCAVRTYLQDFVGIHFPSGDLDLYPRFFAAVRSVLRRIASRSTVDSKLVSASEAEAMLELHWPASEFSDHAHFGLYRRLAARMVVSFSAQFRPHGAAAVELDPQLPIAPPEGTLALHLDLVALTQSPGGTVTATAFRPETIAGDGEKESIKWSDLSERKRLALVFAHGAFPDVRMEVFSGHDGKIYEYLPPNPVRYPRSIPDLLAKARAKHRALSMTTFEATITDFACDGCKVRISCPHWVELL
jgi:superfamily I DNA/RNA helicase